VNLAQDQTSLSVIWHDLECGAYTEDLKLWRALADQHRGPVLDVGAGTGRTALDLAERGHTVTALDRDALLIDELTRRSGDLRITAVVADACEFELAQRFALIIVPMQTIQLLGGAPRRRQFLLRAAQHLQPGGVVAIAISEMLECFSLEDPIKPPTPDMRELDGIVYSSQPTAVRAEAGGYILERLRERIGPQGERSAEPDLVRLDQLTASALEREAAGVGLEPHGREIIPASDDYVGSVVVILGG
jgi:SAM-dependent methyltransferase